MIKVRAIGNSITHTCKTKNLFNEVKVIIQDTKNSNFDSYSGLWDVIKFKIKDFAIRYGKKNKKINLEEKQKLLKIIEDIKTFQILLRTTGLGKSSSMLRLNSIVYNRH